MFKKLYGLLAIVIVLNFTACGAPEERVYGYWQNEDRSLVAYGYGVTISAFELTKDTYKTNILSTPLKPHEQAIYYETSADQIVVRDIISNDAILILRNITSDSLTVLKHGDPTPYLRASKAEIDEIRHKIAESSKRR